MAAIQIVFSGLIMFSAPDGNGYVRASAVTGAENEAHLAWMFIDGDKQKFSKEAVLKGASGRVQRDGAGFMEYVPSVTDALNGAGLDHKPGPCLADPGRGACTKVTAHILLKGGQLSAVLDDTTTYVFEAGGKGTYTRQMAHEVKWSGEATSMQIGGKEVVFKGGEKIRIENHPATSSQRHFGVLRHLWGAGNNNSEEDWPLPVSAVDLRTRLQEALQQRTREGALLSDIELFKVIRLLPSRPQFCPPARQ